MAFMNHVESTRILHKLYSEYYLAMINLSKLIIGTHKYDKGKILLMGNGGSAADCQHFSAELLGQFSDLSRPSIPSISLTTDTSALTSISNDRGYDSVFRRQLEGLYNDNDLLIMYTTSGSSSNIISAMDYVLSSCDSPKLIIFTGVSGYHKLLKVVNKYDNLDHVVIIPSPSDRTATIQEFHEIMYHEVCECIDTMHDNDCSSINYKPMNELANLVVDLYERDRNKGHDEI